MSYRGCVGPKGSYTPVKGSKFRSLQNSVSPDLLKFLHSQPTRKGVCLSSRHRCLNMCNGIYFKAVQKGKYWKSESLCQIEMSINIHQKIVIYARPLT